MQEKIIKYHSKDSKSNESRLCLRTTANMIVFALVDSVLSPNDDDNNNNNNNDKEKHEGLRLYAKRQCV